MARLALLVVSIVAKGAIAVSPACCHHLCPKEVPKSGKECTISLGYDNPPDTCEYNEHCQTCDGEKVCVNTTFATCVREDGGLQGKWRIAMARIAPCPPCEKGSGEPELCTLECNNPVCGSNGRTYCNECLARADCQFDWTKGPCSSSCEKGSGEPELCTGEYDPVCGKNGKTYSNACEAEAGCQKWTKGKCKCKKGRPKPCTKIYRPVCGSNGITYPNECVAKADCEYDFTKGECECDKGSGEPVFCPDVYDPVCGLNGKTYSNACEAEADCQKWTKGECECKKGRPRHCPKNYDPVCASNGETYSNACLAEADCQKWTKGVCCKDTTSKCKKLKKCKKRNTFPNKCQATCAVRCLKDKKFAKKKCPKDHKKKCPPKGKLLDCTDPKTKKSCPGSCPACVLPHDCFTKEVWSEEKVKWCCDNMQLGCCHDGLSCGACLSAGCGFFGSCLPSCDMIADVACYEGDAEKQCAAYDASQRDHKLCNAASPPASPRGAAPPEGSCEACTSTIKGDGTPCRWFANIGACMAEGGLVGPGQTVCPPPSSPP